MLNKCYRYIKKKRKISIVNIKDNLNDDGIIINQDLKYFILDTEENGFLSVFLMLEVWFL